MKRLLALVALLGVAASAQTVSVTSTQLTDSAGNLYSGLIFLQPTLSNGTPTAYRKGVSSSGTFSPTYAATTTSGAGYVISEEIGRARLSLFGGVAVYRFYFCAGWSRSLFQLHRYG